LLTRLSVLLLLIVLGSARLMTTPAQQDSLPGRGLSQHPFLYCGEWQQRGKSEQVMYIVRGGQIVWSYSIPAKEEFGDCTMLSNGNIVFSRRLSASEVTPDKKVVWQYDAPPKTEIHTAQPIGKDRVLIMQNVVQLIEVTPDKKVVWALKNWDVLGPASSTHLLDQPGIPEKREQRR
jgi:hypothetical protein